MTRDLHQHFHNAFSSSSCRQLLKKHEAFLVTHAEQFQMQLASRIISQRSILDQQFRNQDSQPSAKAADSQLMGTPDPANIVWLESQKRAAKESVVLYKAGMQMDIVLLLQWLLLTCQQKPVYCTD